uniref:Uncharacterized protein n=1 Tax=Tilapia lake virus TaxID=1549864 RepID=A0A7S5SP02_9VIRU|nr:hypothetical protein [Tilapia lake virus]
MSQFGKSFKGRTEVTITEYRSHTVKDVHRSLLTADKSLRKSFCFRNALNQFLDKDLPLLPIRPKLESRVAVKKSKLRSQLSFRPGLTQEEAIDLYNKGYDGDSVSGALQDRVVNEPVAYSSADNDKFHRGLAALGYTLADRAFDTCESGFARAIPTTPCGFICCGPGSSKDSLGFVIKIGEFWHMYDGFQHFVAVEDAKFLASKSPSFWLAKRLAKRLNLVPKEDPSVTAAECPCKKVWEASFARAPTALDPFGGRAFCDQGWVYHRDVGYATANHISQETLFQQALSVRNLGPQGSANVSGSIHTALDRLRAAYSRGTPASRSILQGLANLITPVGENFECDLDKRKLNIKALRSPERYITIEGLVVNLDDVVRGFYLDKAKVTVLSRSKWMGYEDLPQKPPNGTFYCRKRKAMLLISCSPGTYAKKRKVAVQEDRFKDMRVENFREVAENMDLNQ